MAANANFGIIAAMAYLLGSIPFGYLLVRAFRGSDIRRTGSGNIGATNVARSSPALGILTLLLDASKGFVAVSIAAALASGSEHLGAGYVYSAMAIAALCAVLGHMFSLWLKFRGGKGVATGVGAFIAIVPKAVLVAICVFAALVALFRYISLGSIVAAAALPAFIYLLYVQPGSPMQSVLGAAVAASLLIIAKHHQNISRLLAGTEHRFSLRRG
ncbi:MAG TPA: glycerol-3-phosphate 1-O-acyltransferase PlsY [Terriglobales bacterium]|jgi:acyl phosphate:glycerol-3-phosphate acyltransferase|nr:glycerol-3-phosphate 1-O-acyltransferase PlsY [Terriglobales bacterium]